MTRSITDNSGREKWRWREGGGGQCERGGTRDREGQIERAVNSRRSGGGGQKDLLVFPATTGHYIAKEHVKAL